MRQSNKDKMASPEEFTSLQHAASYDSSDGNSDDTSISEEVVYKPKVKKAAKRAGRKSSWGDNITGDLVDIVCEDEYFRKKLIFTNNKTQKNSEVYEKVIKQMQKLSHFFSWS